MPGQANTSSTTKALPISEANSRPRMVIGGTKAGRSMYLNTRTSVGHAEGARGLDIVLARDVDHRGAGDARDLARGRRRQRERRQQHVPNASANAGEIALQQRVNQHQAGEIGGDGAVGREPARGRQRVQHVAGEHLQQQGEQEARGDRAEDRRAAAPRLSTQLSLRVAANTPSGTPTRKAMAT